MDLDRDGVLDADDACPVGLAHGPDLDGDGCRDVEDSDLDGDGVPNRDDRCAEELPEGADFDGDGCFEDSDPDDDDDGVVDADDACAETPRGAPDLDADGCEDSRDEDDDGDGVDDASDRCPDRPVVTADSDRDGCDDDRDDTDDDNDGVTDRQDACPSTPRGALDTDRDGCPDTLDLDDDGDAIGDDDELRLSTDPSDARSRPRVLLVSPRASGPREDGLSWPNAFRTLQSALSNLARLQAAGEQPAEIWVAEGFYYPDEGAGQREGDPHASFVLPSNTAIYGGFGGDTEVLRSERDVGLHRSVLSGDLDQDDRSGAVAGLPDTAADLVGTNALTVVVVDGTDGRTVLDGLTITGGDGQAGPAGQPGQGGGLRGLAATPVLSHLHFQANRAVSGGGAFLQGGSIAFSTFVGNATLDGGSGAGLAVEAGHLDADSLLLQANDAGSGTGGAIFVRQASIDMVNTVASDNRALDGAAVDAHDSQLRMDGGRFMTNVATGQGGALNLSGCEANLRSIEVVANHAMSDGAGLRLHATAEIQARTEMFNVVVAGNYGLGDGGGVDCVNDSRFELLMTNVSVAANWADGWGGGLKCDGVDFLAVHNAIIWDNRDAAGGPPNNNATVDGNPFFHSLVQDFPGGVQGNLDPATDSYPLFVRSRWARDRVYTDLDLRIMGGAAVLNAGDDTAPVELGPTAPTVADQPTDLVGRPRVVDGTVDLGAYEGSL